MNTSAVVGHAGWLAGLQVHSCGKDLTLILTVKMTLFSSMNIFYQAAYDTSKGKLVKNNFALGYATSDFVLHSNVNDGSIFGASIYQKVENTGSGQTEVYESTMCIFEGQIRP